MELSPLTAISPADGRYRNTTAPLADYFSEFALIKYRVHVEVEYFIALCELPLPQLKNVRKFAYIKLRKMVKDFSEADALRVKTIERTTNHDVKAVEYFLRERFRDAGLEKYLSFIHFGLTSQDINNTALPMMMRDAFVNVLEPAMKLVSDALNKRVTEWKDISMLAHTHGQPASPTKLGKEIRVFSERISGQLKQLKSIPWSAKFGGATGNFNAHAVAYPDINWKTFANEFVNDTLELKRTTTTTQIEPYDNLAAFCDALARINTILIDFARDMWTYISMDYFKQTLKPGEVGSSAMPHKVNPIDFENAEGNFGFANAMLHHFSQKLPISRMQRDLTDSTVTRNIGVAYAHTLLAFASLCKGLEKVYPNKEKITADLDDNWAVIAEAIQTVLRREGFEDSYEKLKKLTRTGERIRHDTLHSFIETLGLNKAVTKELLDITPFNYTGNE
ncbi:MAG: adenylosuccinate lyase [Bacteroidota bacterium]